MNRGMDKTNGANNHILVFFLAAFFILFSGLLFPENLKKNALQQPVEARLVAEVESVKPGTQFCVAVWLRMEEGWHTYWKNPGDSGLPTSIEWTLPEGFVADDIQWPFPQLFKTSEIVSYGYEDEVFLLTDLHAPSVLKSGTIVRLSASVDWLACKEECVPGLSELAIELPVKEQIPEPDARWAENFANTRKNLPANLTQWKIAAALVKDKIIIQVFPTISFDRKMAHIVFFPEQERLVEYSRPQGVQKVGNGYSIEIQRSKTAAKIPPRLIGVLYTPQGWDSLAELRALRVDVPLHNN